jgi:hypothetical protein
VCDLETSKIDAPYMYDISNLRVKDGCPLAAPAFYLFEHSRNITGHYPTDNNILIKLSLHHLSPNIKQLSSAIILLQVVGVVGVGVNVDDDGVGVGVVVVVGAGVVVVVFVAAAASVSVVWYRNLLHVNFFFLFITVIVWFAMTCKVLLVVTSLLPSGM